MTYGSDRQKIIKLFKFDINKLLFFKSLGKSLIIIQGQGLHNIHYIRFITFKC